MNTPTATYTHIELLAEPFCTLPVQFWSRVPLKRSSVEVQSALWELREPSWAKV